MSEDKYPRDWLTEEEARLRHSDAKYIVVWSSVDQDGERRPAIFVWQREDDADKEAGGDVLVEGLKGRSRPHPLRARPLRP